MTERLNLKKELLEEKREESLAIAARHGAFDSQVFGSVARGDATADRDIDFLADYLSAKRSPWFPVSLIQGLEHLLGSKVDVVTLLGLNDRMRERVLQEASPI
ncbi:MAG: nucleotidyltransferase domain-containing protein [Cyanobacteria bacterium P01_H01_bin.15]